MSTTAIPEPEAQLADERCTAGERDTRLIQICDWLLEGKPRAQIQQAMMMKNLTIMGGLLAIAVHGAGGLSLDTRQA